jgi:5'(3')-deoxyribonucleotidase
MAQQLIEGILDAVFNKLQKKLDAATNYATKQKMKRDPVFAQHMKRYIKATDRMKDFIKQAESDPDIKREMDRIARGED